MRQIVFILLFFSVLLSGCVTASRQDVSGLLGGLSAVLSIASQSTQSAPAANTNPFYDLNIPSGQGSDSGTVTGNRQGSAGIPMPNTNQTLTQDDSSHGATRWTFPHAKKVNRNAVAVIIGNRNYSGKGHDIPNVDYAHNDANAMKTYLLETLGYREGNIIFYQDASQAELMSAFGTNQEPRGRLFDYVKPGKSDVFVYYSGHGAPSLSSGQGFLLPVDADPRRVAINGYSLETLFTNLGKVPARNMTVVIDACFSGSSQSGSVIRNASSISLKVVNVQAKLPKASVLTASDVSEVASWDTEAKHGLFTKHFLEGVCGQADGEDFGNSDGQVTLAELREYLEDQVTYRARRLHSRDQHPQVSGKDNQIFSTL